MTKWTAQDAEYAEITKGYKISVGKILYIVVAIVLWAIAMHTVLTKYDKYLAEDLVIDIGESYQHKVSRDDTQELTKLYKESTKLEGKVALKGDKIELKNKHTGKTSYTIVKGEQDTAIIHKKEYTIQPTYALDDLKFIHEVENHKE